MQKYLALADVFQHCYLFKIMVNRVRDSYGIDIRVGVN